MSVFGVDLGNLNSVVAITRNGGIDVITNEVSKRETATFVSLTDQERFIGESGLDRYVRNYQNTVACVKRFIGARADDADLELEKRFLSCPTSADDKGRLMFDVNYGGEAVSLYPEQVLAMVMQQLRKYVNRESTLPDAKIAADVRDAVITVPCFYTAEQRRLVVQACEIAGVNAMSLINESTAASIDYGIFRGQSLPEKESDAQIVAVLDVGYGATTVAVTAFWRGNLKVLARVAEKHFGTRNIDYALFEHFAAEIAKKYKVDVTQNKRARIRLLQACDRVKYLLSGNQSTPLNVENLMDVDVSISNFQRSEMETLSEPLMERFKAMLTRSLAEAGISADRLHSCEIIGGGCRIPMIKKAVEEALGKTPSFTLNASESVARGAAITAAVFSPKFQVREFVVNEISQFPVKVGYFLENAASVSAVPFLPQVNKVVALLGKGDTYPKVLEVTTKRSDAFALYAFYDDEAPDVRTFAQGKYVIGEWNVSAASKPTNGEVKVRVRFLASGIVTVDSATTAELYEVEEVEEPKKDAAAAAAAPAAAEGEAAPEKIVKKIQKQRKLELGVAPNVGVLGLSAETVVRARAKEEEMHKKDLHIVKTKEAKNELEAYVLDNRGRVAAGGIYAEFVLPTDAAEFARLADEYETWLYDDGADASLDEYISRIVRLKGIGAPAAARHRLADDLPFAHGQFQTKVAASRELALGSIGKAAAHVTEEELRAAAAKADAALDWGRAEVAAYEAAPKTQPPAFALSAFDAKAKEVDIAVRAAINKPAPPAPKKEKAAEGKTPSSSPPPQGAPADDSAPPPPPPPAPEAGVPPQPMDLD